MTTLRLTSLFLFGLFLCQVGGQLASNDPCDTYYDYYGHVSLAIVNQTAVCWRIWPTISGRDPKYIDLNWRWFSVEDGMTLSIYTDAYTSDHKLVGTYTGTLGDETAPPATQQIESNIVLLVLQGTGTRTFQVSWDCSYETIAPQSLVVFIALIFVFVFSLIFACISICPCVKNQNKMPSKMKGKVPSKLQQKGRLPACLQIGGIVVGLFFFGLVLGGVFSL